MIATEKASEKVIEYIETLILAGKLKVDDRLPAERDLAQTLQVSRSAVREGVRLLETIGIVESRQGSGNYIARHFDQTLEQVLTMMYALDTLSYEQIREFRYAVERQALALAVRSSDEKKKKELQQHLEGMLYGESEEQQTESDRLLHQTLVEMSGNRLVIANYVALNRIINRFIGQVRKEIRSEGGEEFEAFQAAHRQLVTAVLDGDLEKGKEALDRHFVFITRDFDT
ncbi:MAG: FadR family transcriptional regulator [Oscillospiraceae bacterium]|nr:FadR family transcriptional regulator [Oscillospiraceae bacterium]